MVAYLLGDAEVGGHVRPVSILCEKLGIGGLDYQVGERRIGGLRLSEFMDSAIQVHVCNGSYCRI